MSSDPSGIVFYDGVCGFCNKFINWVVVRDRHRRLRFAPLQGATARKLIPKQYTQNLSTVVLHTDRGNYTHSAAVCRILFAIGGPWALAAALLWLIPLPLRNLGYSLIGRIRYRLFGKLDQCRIPTAEERSLFLD
jgi:predicted DCC family thiol-disulfide oxidoreductase YuxK